jgi:predicted DNA binding CopG/RHH family protein
MNTAKEFPFSRARRITDKEVKAAKNAIEKKTGRKRKLRGRPPKSLSQKYKPVSIRLVPKILTWAKKEAKKRGIGYQTVINEVLLENVA